MDKDVDRSTLQEKIDLAMLAELSDRQLVMMCVLYLIECVEPGPSDGPMIPVHLIKKVLWDRLNSDYIALANQQFARDIAKMSF